MPEPTNDNILIKTVEKCTRNVSRMKSKLICKDCDVYSPLQYHSAGLVYYLQSFIINIIYSTSKAPSP